MKALLTGFFVFVFIVCTGLESGATPVNGSFETGNLDGWEPIGDVIVQTGTIGSGPTQGDYQTVLTNDYLAYYVIGGNGSNPSGNPWCDYVYPLSGNPAVGQSIMNDAFFGLPAGAIEGVTVDPIHLREHAYLSVGSGMKQSFYADAGDKLSFDWNYLTSDGLNWDFAFVSLVSPTVAVLEKLAGNVPLDSPFLESLCRSDTLFANETGFSTFSFVVPAEGEYTLGFGVFQVGGANVLDSGLIVDNVRVTPIPEPATFFLLGTGLVGLVIGRRRFWGSMVVR